MANPRLMGHNFENRGILITNFRKKELNWIWEKGKKSKKPKSHQKFTRVHEQESSVQSASRAQCKPESEKINLIKAGNWSFTSENTGVM